MTYFFYILLNNIVPLTLMIAVGVVLRRSFNLDMKTLSKLNFYLFSPCIIFKMLYESKLSLAIMGQVLLFFAIFFCSLFLLMELIMRVRGYKGGMRSAMRNSVIFYNSANYGVPLNQLVFVGDSFTLSIQIIIMMMQNLIPNTYGVYSVNAHRQKFRETLRTIASLPAIYVIPLALLMKGFHVPVPQPIYTPINYVAGGFIAIALTTLGAQLGGMKWKIRLADVALANIMRLCVGPALGFAVVTLLGIHGMMAQALVLSCAVPTSLSSVLLAVEFDNEPEFASQAVFSSTLFSIFSVTVVIYMLKYIA
jgi:hypothetical protein